MKRFAAAATLALALSFGAALASDQTALIANAAATVRHMREDQSFGPSADLLHRARAVLIVPGLVKGGFMFGAEGGNGVLLRREGERWSNPAFYTLASGSFGLQIGLEKAEVVMFIMSQRALEGIERNKFKVGAGAGLTVVTVGANAQGATAPNLSGDIIIWSATQGAYGGLTLEGSIVDPKIDWNDDFYGKRTHVGRILSDLSDRPETTELRTELAATRRAGAP
jgi:lipid-binding SYLF domain-containing protein